MNSKSLKDKIRNLSRETHIDSHALMQNYFLERLLVRLSFCDYKENIIIKGGMLIASLIGSGQRSTMDLDATIKQFPMRETDDYNGFRIKVDAYFERIIQHLKIDLSTGDMITPGAIDYLYRPMFGDDDIHILTYNLETIIAEKYETVICRGTANTRRCIEWTYWCHLSSIVCYT